MFDSLAPMLRVAAFCNSRRECRLGADGVAEGVRVRRITGGRGLRVLLGVGLAVVATATVASAGATSLASSTLRTSNLETASSVLEGIPHFAHVVVLTEENKDASATFGPTSPATYLNSLVSQGVFLPNYYGTGHVSLDNYLAMVSGQPGNVLSNSDCMTVSLWTCAQAASAFDGGANIGDQLDAAGISWNSWMDGTSTPCFHGPYTPPDLSNPSAAGVESIVEPDPYQGDSTAAPAYNYADRHNPFIYFTNFIGNQARCEAHQLPFSYLSNALSGGSSTWTDTTLPGFSFITPDTCHDGHDNPCAGGSPGGLVSLDAWLSANLPPLLQYLDTHDGLLVINFDESDPGVSAGGVNESALVGGYTPSACTSCVSVGAGGRTGALLLGTGLAAGTTDTTGYDHYSLLRTIEDSFGISNYLGLAALAKPMTAAFSS